MQLERVDALLASEKRLCSQELMTQAKDQTETFLLEEIRKLRAELGLSAVSSAPAGLDRVSPKANGTSVRSTGDRASASFRWNSSR